ncbi:MAG: hypothetical protein K6T78_15790 [Alicyclobacillus sp.]|nr:hypothetical protein [Alicyclobacillus sp.]
MATQVVQLDFLRNLGETSTPARKRVTYRVRRYSPALLARYRGLADIPPEEYHTFFPKTDKPWSIADRQYLLEWWGKDDILSLSYAIGRPPWSLQREICRLRKHGIVAIPYLREQH